MFITSRQIYPIVPTLPKLETMPLQGEALGHEMFLFKRENKSLNYMGFSVTRRSELYSHRLNYYSRVSCLIIMYYFATCIIYRY